MEEKAAMGFVFEKTKLGINLTDFKKRFPKSELDKEESDEKLKHACYIAEATWATLCSYYFFDDKLYEMRIAYVTRKLDKLGGMEALVEKMVEKFGHLKKEDFTVDKDKSEFTAIWQFQKVDRELRLFSDLKSVVISVTDLALLKELKSRKKKAGKTGFDD